MRLSKIYSNQTSKFEPVKFNLGLNVVLGHVTKAKSRKKNTHNLGKSLFAQVIDFCLFKKGHESFLVKRMDLFKDFVFFLEIALHSGGYITVRRSVEESSKGAFKRHDTALEDFSELSEHEWDHWNLPFEKAKEVLDGALDLTALKPWTFRNAVAYSLRTQKDFDEPFKLAKFAGGHAQWKPFLAHVLGFDGQVVARGYELEEEIARLKADEEQLLTRASGITDPDQLRGQAEIVGREVAILEDELGRFDFSPQDNRTTRDLVQRIDSEIVLLNERRYSAVSDKAKIESALNVRLSIDLKSLEKIYNEAKVYFADQVKKDFDALQEFNKQLAEERDEYLKQDLEVLNLEISELDVLIRTRNTERAAAISSLSDPASISKYKRLTSELIGRRTDLEELQRAQSLLVELTAKKKEIKGKEEELKAITAELEKAVDIPPSRYQTIRTYFDEIVKKVIDRHANLYSRVNGEDHLEFQWNILDDAAKPSQAGDGFSYGRLMCIAFDLAIIRAYLKDPFPHFVFHDGVLETFEDRMKLNLLSVIRDYCKLGIQHIVTAIDSEIPRDGSGRRVPFSPSEVILTLTDEGPKGRLFKMPEW